MINDSQNLYYLKVLTWFSSFVIVLFHYSLWFGLDYYEENILIDYFVKRKEYGANFVYLYWAITGYTFISFYRLKKTIVFKKFLINIFARYYPLHFLTLIVVFIIQFLSTSIYGKTQFGYSNDWYHFILHLFFFFTLFSRALPQEESAKDEKKEEYSRRHNNSEQCGCRTSVSPLARASPRAG